MLWTKLRNKFLKNPTEANKFSYTQQRNWCVSLLIKEKKNDLPTLTRKYFASLNEKNNVDNKTFW